MLFVTRQPAANFYLLPSKFIEFPCVARVERYLCIKYRGSGWRPWSSDVKNMYSCNSTSSHAYGREKSCQVKGVIFIRLAYASNLAKICSRLRLPLNLSSVHVDKLAAVFIAR